MSFSSGLQGHFRRQNESQNRTKIEPKSLPRRSWSRVAAGSHFGLHFGFEAKSLPGAFKKASKRVPKKASILDPIFKLFYSILEAPGGVKMASKIASKTASASKLGLSTPGSAHFDPLGPRFWSLRELIFERFWSALSPAFSTPRCFILERLRKWPGR